MARLFAARSMPQNFAPTSLMLSKNCWLSSEDLTEDLVSPAIKASLQYKGLLTLALGKVYGRHVSVECLSLSEWADDRSILGLRRDVLLRADDIPCVRASTLIPSQVINTYPWLAGLGSRPLGEMLEKRVRHQRGTFEYTQVDVNLVLRPTARASQYSWARRYKFFLECGDLLVMEIFFPGVLDRLGRVSELHLTLKNDG
jgi:chorismate-pyruvate lyase